MYEIYMGDFHLTTARYHASGTRWGSPSRSKGMFLLKQKPWYPSPIRNKRLEERTKERHAK